jgi:hypothetical protein
MMHKIWYGFLEKNKLFFAILIDLSLQKELQER